MLKSIKKLLGIWLISLTAGFTTLFLGWGFLKMDTLLNLVFLVMLAVFLFLVNLRWKKLK